MSYQYETILVERREASLRLILNRPHERNSTTMALLNEMREALGAVAGDDEVRVVIVTGAGESFCAGMSLKEFQERKDSPAKMAELRAVMFDCMEALRFLNKPTIAAVNGWCLGGGLNILTACDLAIASEKAKFGLPEINWGGFPAGGAMRSILRPVPVKHAFYLILTGATIDGNEAARIGLVNQAVQHEDLESAVGNLARKLSGLDPLALAWAKKVAQGSLDIPEFNKAVEYENDQVVAFRQLATQERLAPRWKAFIDKKYKPGLETYQLPGQEDK